MHASGYLNHYIDISPFKVLNRTVWIEVGNYIVQMIDFRKARVRWLLCLEKQDGLDHSTYHSDVSYHRMCACVRWFSLTPPPLKSIRKLKIYAASPIIMEKENTASRNRCGGLNIFCNNV